MSHDLDISTTLIPELNSLPCNFEVFMTVGAVIEEVADDYDSSFLRLLSWSRHDLRWLRLNEAPNWAMAEIASRLRLRSSKYRFVVEAIDLVLDEREKFRSALTDQARLQVLLRNKLRTDFEKLFGHSISKDSLFAWAARNKVKDHLMGTLEGFFADVNHGRIDSKGRLAMQLCSVYADRIC